MSSIKEFEHLQIRLQVLKSATNDFAENCCIGRGGFGKVYKGEIVLSGVSTMVAIKRLDTSLGQGNVEFRKEIMMLSQYKNKNVVSLLGFCDEGHESLLVYEYLPKKSLESYLSSPGLFWRARVVICLGVAKGLTFLHEPKEGCRVLHRDIKSANILLDDNWQPKIADFGLSKLVPANQQYSYAFTNAVGTRGYCDPLYANTDLLTKESDIYSFGVLLFEVLCGRPAYVQNDNDICKSFAELAMKCYEEKNLDTIIFTGIREEIPTKSLERFSAIAYQCLHKDRAQRPSMAKIVKEIEIAYFYQELTNISLPEVPLKEIEVATENFKMCIWENDQYRIYKGELCISGKPTMVFIKRFCDGHWKGDMVKVFLGQITTLSVRPPQNTMSLVGYCDGEKEKIIVHEYAEHGSLDQYIRRSSRNTLTWLTRLEICCGAARGLDELHKLNIMRNALQSTKILLDSNWVAKVAGFMISMPDRLDGGVVADHRAYSSPEYICSGKASKEADVYSLGVVLFEVLCGRLCTEEDLDGYASVKEMYEKKKVDEIVDPVLREQKISSYMVDKYSAIAYRCLLDDPKKRPAMGAVIKELEELIRIQLEFENLGKKLLERAKAAEEREQKMQEKMELIEKELARERTLRIEMQERMKKFY